MKKLLVILTLSLTALSPLATAQVSAPAFAKPAAKEPTIAEMKLQLAQDKVDITNLKLQLIAAQAQVNYRQTQDELSTAQTAVKAATPKPDESKSGTKK